MSARPPRWAERLVERWSAGSTAGPSVAGDLWVEWDRARRVRGVSAADRWYAVHAIRISARFALGRVADALRSAPGALVADARITLRGLRSSYGFALVSVLSLGGGLGLTTAVFAMINGLLFAPLPWPDSDRLVDLNLEHPREVCAGCSAGVSYPVFEAWRDRGAGFESIGAMQGLSVLFSAPSGTERVQATGVSPEVPGLLGITPASGRLFTADEHASSGAPVAIVSHSLWERGFGGAGFVRGSAVRIDGTLHEIVGVLPVEAGLLDRGELWVPLEQRVGASPSAADLGLWVFARLDSGADPAILGESLNVLLAGLAVASSELDDEWSVRVVPMRAGLIGEVGDPQVGWILLAAAGAVLLIACLNLASLLLARVTERSRELCVRAALGSGGTRLARLVLVEAGVVALLGVVVAMAVTLWARGALVASIAGAMPPWASFPIDLRVWGVGLGGALFAVLFCGVAPALRAAPGGARGILPGSSATRGPSVLRRHRVLLVGQVGVGVALVASTALAVQSFQRASDFGSIGYRWEEILGVRVVADGPAYEEADQRAALHARSIEGFAAHPAVSAATAEARMFIGSWGAADGPSPMHIEGSAEPVPDMIVPRHSMAVAEGYFDLFEIPILRGRAITAGDVASAPRVAVVNREAARLLWPAGDPLGARFTIDNGSVEGSVTVVGVAGDVVMNLLSESRRPQARIYFSLPQTEVRDVTYRLAYGGMAPSRGELVATLAEIDPGLPIESVTTVHQELRRWITPVTMTAGIMGALGSLALVLLALGVFGTLSYQVAARAREIGIRRALGAGESRIIRDTARDTGRVVLAGLLLGVGLTALAGKALRSGFVQIGTTDPCLLAASGGMVVTAAAVAAWSPLRHALRVDPLETLKTE